MSDFNIVAIIPAYNPDEKMLETIAGLREVGFKNIIVVDDGSKPETKSFFLSARRDYGCRVLIHAVNQGQGRALKTAFNDVLVTYPECIGAVAVDADGQHSPKDAYACAMALIESPECFIIGCRDFSQPDVPKRSRIGNVITRNVLKLLCGVNVSDTQTGLRGFSCELMKKLIFVKGDRYEFCTTALLEAKKQEVPMKEVKISTIYIDGNKSSHFNPLKDSIRIYALIFMFLFSSISSFLVDMVLFSILLGVTSQFSLVYNTMIATYAARVCSALFNYKVNRNLVFKKGAKNSIVKYIVLCVVQVTLSYLGVFGFSNLLGWHPIPTKVFIDTVLFLVSFQIQREWVFKTKK